jgi:ribosome biogenesis GTPase / thiamine phosphate phosphatase
MYLLDLHGGNARVVMVAAQHCRIETVTEHRVEAIVRGKLRNQPGFSLAVGDVVTADSYGDHWMIESVAPRRNEFVREGLRKERQVLFANADRVLILASLAQPQTKIASLDRFLVAALKGNVPPVLVLAKTDLDEGGAHAQALRDLYAALNIRIFPVCNITGEGSSAIADILRAGISAFIGNSGVGKTSLLNRLIPGLDLRVREVSTWSGKGTHTTSSALLFPFGEHAALVDTPGMKSFVPYGVTRATLMELFPDLQSMAASCRFSDCRHLSEPECAILAAVERGDLPASRLRSYHRLYEDLPR